MIFAKDLISKANELLRKFQISGIYVSALSDIHTDYFVVLYEKLCGQLVPDKISPVAALSEEVHNCQAVIDSLSMDVLHISLSHINGQDIVNGQTTAISNLLDIFSDLYEYLLANNSRNEIPDRDREWRPPKAEKSITFAIDEVRSEGSTVDLIRESEEFEKRMAEKKVLRTSWTSLHPPKKPNGAGSSTNGVEKSSRGLKESTDSKMRSSNPKVVTTQTESGTQSVRTPQKARAWTELKRVSPKKEIEQETKRQTSPLYKYSSPEKGRVDSYPDTLQSRKDVEEELNRLNSFKSGRCGSATMYPMQRSHEDDGMVTPPRRSPARTRLFEEHHDPCCVNSPEREGTLAARYDWTHVDATCGVKLRASPPHRGHLLDDKKLTEKDSLGAYPRTCLGTDDDRLYFEHFRHSELSAFRRPPDGVMSDECHYEFEERPSMRRKVSRYPLESVNRLSPPLPGRVPSPDRLSPSRVGKENDYVCRRPISPATSRRCLLAMPASKKVTFDPDSETDFGLTKTDDDQLPERDVDLGTQPASEEMGRVRDRVQQEKTLNQLKAQLLRNLLDARLKDARLHKLMSQPSSNRAKSPEKKETRPGTRKTARRVAKKPASYLMPKSKPLPLESEIITQRKGGCLSPPRSPLTRSKSEGSPKRDGLLPHMLDEFPVVNLSPSAAKQLWKKEAQYLATMNRIQREIEKKKPKSQVQLEEAIRKHDLLTKIMQKEMAHARRMRDIREKRESEALIRNRLRQQRLESAKLKQYYDEYYLQQRAKMILEKQKEEILLKRIYEENVNAQKSYADEMRKYAKEVRDKEATVQRNETESMENFYRDKFEIMTEATARERKEDMLRGDAQKKMVRKIRQQLRKKMEHDTGDLQKQLTRCDDAEHWREVDAEQFQRKLKATRLGQM